MNRPCVSPTDIDEARSRVRLLEACDGLEVTFFRDKYPALDGLIHITEPVWSVTELSNVLVAFQLKAKSRERVDTNTSVHLPLSDLGWIVTLPIPTVLFVADLKVQGIYLEWITRERTVPRYRKKPGAPPAEEPTRTFTPSEQFSSEKFKKDAVKISLDLLRERTSYATTPLA